MSKSFVKDSELIKYMTFHLEELYDALTKAEQENDYSTMDYCQGSIDSTHVYLIKSGVSPMEYEAYLEIVTRDWKPAE